MATICEEEVEKKRARMEDRLTKLPVELQLRILSFLEAKQAVQTALLSKTWISLWTQIPVLQFNCFANYRNLYAFDRFVNKVFCLRDRSAKLDRLTFIRNRPPRHKPLKTVFDYAISHGVKQLEVRIGAGRKSKSLKSQKLQIQFHFGINCPFRGLRSGSFKDLTDLYLKRPHNITDEEQPFSGLKLIDCDISTKGENPSLHTLNHTDDLTISCYEYFECEFGSRLTFFRYQGFEFPLLITPAPCLPDDVNKVISWLSEYNQRMHEKRLMPKLP